MVSPSDSLATGIKIDVVMISKMQVIRRNSISGKHIEQTQPGIRYETGARQPSRQKAQGVMITATRRRAVIAAPIIAPPRAAEVDSRTRELLRGAIVPTLLRLAWPNILVMLAQASTGLIETWWVSHLGTDALAGMALVFPVVMLMQRDPTAPKCGTLGTGADARKVTRASP